ncbi:phosphopyruvate hydratase [uncultured Paludibaculum sp.]|uniref:phosphopyruvate hydratase n=1 Tax=uncultured Paludibaculum sp. TaxID=1765020 RepID=UPI002AAB1D9C|nr:phosphopyruvate hydratase [uncultured Paludibaculum sp.]
MSLTIAGLRALQILDSRGVPTLEVEVRLSNGVSATAQVPSGASTGRYEAVELRDGDPDRYAGKGVTQACRNVENEIAAAVTGLDAGDQASVDRRMIELDGTPSKSRLGANAILGVSCAVARAASQCKGEPLWQTLSCQFGTKPTLPLPMVNILSGGLHAGRQVEFQDFLAVAHGLPTYSESLHAIVSIHRETRKILDDRGFLLTGVADEGGWGPVLPSNEAALAILTQAIERAGFRPVQEVSIAIDAASSHFHDGGRYVLRSEGRTLEVDELIDLYATWADRYPIRSLEDGLDQDDWAGWVRLTQRLGGRMQLIGDDFFTTNAGRLQQGIAQGAANAVLVKMNQIGTLTETFEVLALAAQAGWRAVVSARSGETEDSFLADLACASGAGQIKVGSVTRSSRLSKYNRLLALERDSQLTWTASSPWF